MEYLGIKDYYAKSSHKVSDYEDFKLKYNLQDSEILMMGDDIPDIRIMKLAEISACPANAVPEVKAISDYISPVFGGKGAVRDVIEQVMKVQGKWNLDEETKSA
jgi:3-deoxy-D-manno-octulosonate 8-phosphate phosphatase (KDO 8-P phosphatase)